MKIWSVVIIIFYCFAILMNGVEVAMQFFTYRSPLIAEDVPWLVARPYLITIVLYGAALGVIVKLYRKQKYSMVIITGVVVYVLLALSAYL